MRYVKVEWDHDDPDDPVRYLSELGDDGYEVRKVQVYRGGSAEWADEEHESERVGLSEIPFPPLGEISNQPEFRADPITRAEFERVWDRSRQAR